MPRITEVVRAEVAHNKSFELTLDRFLAALSLCSSPSRAAQLKRYMQET